MFDDVHNVCVFNMHFQDALSKCTFRMYISNLLSYMHLRCPLICTSFTSIFICFLKAMRFWTENVQPKTWMSMLRNCGLGDKFQGRNIKQEIQLAQLFRETVVPFYLGRNSDTIVVRGVSEVDPDNEFGLEATTPQVHSECSSRTHIWKAHTERALQISFFCLYCSCADGHVRATSSRGIGNSNSAGPEITNCLHRHLDGNITH